MKQSARRDDPFGIITGGSRRETGRRRAWKHHRNDPRETAARYGSIDVLVNHAGYGLEGAIEETSMAQARHLFEVNFFGALQLIKAALPGMRTRRSGHIVNISSIGGLLAYPGIGIYDASKHALEGRTDSLSQEVAHPGIRVIAIEPGPFRTNRAGSSMVHAETRIDEYEASAGAMREAMAKRNGRQMGDPVRAAAAIIRVVASDEPPRRWVLGASGYKQVGENPGGRQAELARWVEVSLGAGFPSGERQRACARRRRYRYRQPADR